MSSELTAFDREDLIAIRDAITQAEFERETPSQLIPDELFDGPWIRPAIESLIPCPNDETHSMVIEVGLCHECGAR
jgi:hypothetical protein